LLTINSGKDYHNASDILPIEYSHHTVSGAFMGSLRLSKNQKKVLMA